MSGYQPTEWLSDGQTCGGLRVCVGKGRPGRNASTYYITSLRRLLPNLAGRHRTVPRRFLDSVSLRLALNSPAAKD